MKFQTFEAQVSDKSGTIDGEPLVCRSFTQAKKFLLDWLLTRVFNPVNGAPEIVAKPGVTATITPVQTEFDYPSEAEVKGYRPARPQEAKMPAKTFVPVKGSKGEWQLAELNEAERAAALAAAAKAKADAEAAAKAKADAEAQAKADAEAEAQALADENAALRAKIAELTAKK